MTTTNREAVTETQEPFVLDVISSEMQKKYPGDPMRNGDANRMLRVYLHIAAIVNCTRGVCLHEPCDGVMTHIDYLAEQMKD